jgi:aspartate racemase
LRERFVALLQTIESDTVVLARTELPLIADVPVGKRLVDATCATFAEDAA